MIGTTMPLKLPARFIAPPMIPTYHTGEEDPEHCPTHLVEVEAAGLGEIARAPGQQAEIDHGPAHPAEQDRGKRAFGHTTRAPPSLAPAFAGFGLSTVQRKCYRAWSGLKARVAKSK